jgi:hypothetical protein
LYSSGFWKGERKTQLSEFNGCKHPVNLISS